jgi:hypothetical protein
MTKKQLLLDKLHADGEVSNVWAVQNGIWRLSERVRECEQAGWQFSKGFVEEGGKKTKTYRYIVQERPKQTVYVEEVRDGQVWRVAQTI